jgi:hypothetical protein
MLTLINSIFTFTYKSKSGHLAVVINLKKEDKF